MSDARDRKNAADALRWRAGERPAERLSASYALARAFASFRREMHA